MRFEQFSERGFSFCQGLAFRHYKHEVDHGTRKPADLASPVKSCQVSMQTEMGQLLDMTTEAPGGGLDFSRFTIEVSTGRLA